MQTIESDRATAPPPPILCGIPEAARMLGRGTRFIYEQIARGTIKAYKSDKRTLVLISSLHEYVATLKPAKIKPLRRRTAA
jgi:excisionase family DNA binding protein